MLLAAAICGSNQSMHKHTAFDGLRQGGFNLVAIKTKNGYLNCLFCTLDGRNYGRNSVLWLNDDLQFDATFTAASSFRFYRVPILTGRTGKNWGEFSLRVSGRKINRVNVVSVPRVTLL